LGGEHPSHLVSKLVGKLILIGSPPLPDAWKFEKRAESTPLAGRPILRVDATFARLVKHLLVPPEARAKHQGEPETFLQRECLEVDATLKDNRGVVGVSKGQSRLHTMQIA
jgi:hypothetical protein